VYDFVRIDPCNAFRIHVSVAKYTLVNGYGVLDIEVQEHDLWFDSCNVYTLSRFLDDMASKIILGSNQQQVLAEIVQQSGRVLVVSNLRR
jgi:hypothetical protein